MDHDKKFFDIFRRDLPPKPKVQGAAPSPTSSSKKLWLGAKKKTITTQFLTESIILTFSGGIVGIVVGVIASYFICYITGSPFVLSPVSIIIAFVVSAGIGILFGWYPAQKAANLQPIEALRYE